MLTKDRQPLHSMQLQLLFLHRQKKKKENNSFHFEVGDTSCYLHVELFFLLLEILVFTCKSTCNLDLPLTTQTLSLQFFPSLLSTSAIFISLTLQALIFQCPHSHEQAVSQEIKENISHILELIPRLQG